MKTLSSVATIILPLTLVTGMFGMNVTVPCTCRAVRWLFLAPVRDLS